MNIRLLLSGIIVLFMLCLSDCSKQVPVASFSTDYAIVGAGDIVHFTDQSINAPTKWEWTFQGGTPSSSTSQNPSIRYDEAGKYEVSLVVSNGDGSDEVTRANCITVQLPPPVAAFTADYTNISAGGWVNYTDLSSNEPSSWNWTFEGGTPATSNLQNPAVKYISQGVFSVSLLVSNVSGVDYLQKDHYISVTQPVTSITFYNTTYTDIYIEINGIKKVIPPEGSVTYSNLTGNSVDYYAYTSGKTSDGTQVGYLLNWDNSIALTGSQITRTLLVNNSYYFLYIQNEGTESLNPLEVGIMDVLNGFSADRTENIVIPNDNEEYRIGYYQSYSATEFNWIQIRAYAPTWYAYWSQGAQFTLPDTSNQSIHLYSSVKKKSAESSWKDPGDPVKYLYPDYAIRQEDQPRK